MSTFGSDSATKYKGDRLDDDDFKDYKYRGWRWLPVFTAIVATATLATIQILAHTLNHVPSWFYFAPFSIAAVGVPERYIYLVGMVVASTLFLLSAYVVDKMLIQYARQSFHFTIKLSRVIVVAMAVGLAVQGCATLQDDIVDKMDGGKPTPYTAASYIHLVGAGVFFAGSTLYLLLFVVLCATSEPEDLQAVIHKPSRVTKYILFALVASSVVVAFFIHPAMHLVTDGDKRAAYNAGGMMQWICVASLMIFILSLTFDLTHAHELDTGAAPIDVEADLEEEGDDTKGLISVLEEE